MQFSFMTNSLHQPNSYIIYIYMLLCLKIDHKICKIRFFKALNKKYAGTRWIKRLKEL